MRFLNFRNKWGRFTVNQASAAISAAGTGSKSADVVFKVMPQSPYQVVLNTCPDENTAQSIATALVEQRLAACVNIVPGVVSIYRWQGKTHQDQELLLVIKSMTDAFPAISECIQSLHPYELPEIIAVPIGTGLQQYLSWLSNPEQ